MRVLDFYGHSDDCFEIRGTDRNKGEPDEINCYDEEVVVALQSSEGSLRVVGKYVLGAWSIGILPAGDDAPMEAIPRWLMEWSLADNGYSTQLRIFAPSDTAVRKVDDDA